MIKNLLTVAAALFSLATFSRETPYGYEMPKEQLNAVGIMELETFDHASLLEEDIAREHHGGRTRTGRITFMDELDATNCGTWFNLDNGDRVWLLHFRSMDAQAMNVYFNQLYLPEGSSMFLYSADLTYYEGPYSTSDCNEHGLFGTAEVFGDEAYLEYFEPAGVLALPSLGLYGFGHMYNHVHDYRSETRGGGSDACEVDVNCPEGDDWTAQRDAVVRLTLVDGGDQFLCSASMINNTARDCRNFILTAFHCCEGIDDADLLLCVVRFNYERASCGTGSIPSRNKTGVIKHADSADGGGNSGSDFALFELEDPIPGSYDVYYAGWDANTTTPQSGVGIHHPSGDIKKISTSDEMASSGWGVANTHWEVQWMETVTEWGVTEGGSSGSPLFNQQKRIVGQLTGGGSCCTTNGCGQGTGPSAEDYYGKMSKNWNGNPNPTTDHLEVWLDPANTNEMAMDGAYPDTKAAQPCNPVVNLEETLAFSDVNIYPTSSDGQVTITSSKFRDISEVKLYNSAGALVQVLKLSSEQTSFDLRALSAGFYYVSFVHTSDMTVTKKFTIAK